MAYDEDLADRVRAVLPPAEAVTERQMFGGLAFMLGGHMFCGVVRDALMVRLGPDGADRALSQPHVRPMDFTGQPMKGMVFVEPVPAERRRRWRCRPGPRLEPGPTTTRSRADLHGQPGRQRSAGLS